MMRIPIWAITLMFVAGVSLAAPPSLELPVRAPQAEQPTLSQDWSLEEFVLSAEEEVTAEEVVIARKRSKKGGKRGGASSKNRGGFKSGNERQAKRAGKPGSPGKPGRPGDPGGVRGGVDRDVNVDRDVHVDRDVDFDDDNDEAKAALVGGIIGLGVGAMIADEPDPVYVEQP
jgi:hypothetical protein